MNTIKLVKYQLRDVSRSRWIFFYFFFFLIATDVLFRFGGTGDRVILSMMNIILMIIPLVSIMLGTMFLYNSREYIELILTQPVKRIQLYFALFTGLVVPMSIAVGLGVALPFIWQGAAFTHFSSLVFLITASIALTLIFCALAFYIALKTEDKIKGLGLAIILWLFFAVVYDGIILMVIYMFSDYPLQQPVLIMSMLNPLDMGRIALLIRFDASALMGFTGAVFQRFFGSTFGLTMILICTSTWILTPLLLGMRSFVRKDF